MLLTRSRVPSLTIAALAITILPFQATSKFELGTPADCFSEWWDEPTQEAFARFTDNAIYEFETVSDLPLAIERHSWDQPFKMGDLAYKLSWPKSDSIAQVQLGSLYAHGTADAQSGKQVYSFNEMFPEGESETPITQMIVRYNWRDEIENIGFSSESKPWSDGQPLSRPGDKFLRDTEGFSDDDYLIAIGEGQRIVGLTAKLRSRKQGFVELGDGGLQQLAPKEKTLVALGLVVFDETNPMCARHPSADSQYIFEWAYANLDQNGDSFLDQTELDVLRSAAPEVAASIKTGSYSMNFQDFVRTVWQGQDGSSRLDKIKDYLRKPEQYQTPEIDVSDSTEESTTEDKDSEDEELTLDDFAGRINDFSVKVPDGGALNLNGNISGGDSDQSGAQTDTREDPSGEQESDDSNSDPFVPSELVDPASDDETVPTPKETYDGNQAKNGNSAVNADLLTALRQDIASNDAELKQSQQTNELILLVVIGLLVILIATVFIMIIAALRNKKKQDRQLAQQVARRLEMAARDDAVQNMVEEQPGFESPVHSGRNDIGIIEEKATTCNRDSEFGASRGGISNLQQAQLKAKNHDAENVQVYNHKQKIVGLPEPYSPLGGNNLLNTQKDFIESQSEQTKASRLVRHDILRQTADSSNFNFRQNQHSPSPAVNTFDRHVVGGGDPSRRMESDDFERVHSERDENDNLALEQLQDDSAQQPFSMSQATFMKNRNQLDVMSQNQNNSQLQLALRTPQLQSPGQNDRQHDGLHRSMLAQKQSVASGVPANMSHSMAESSSRVKDISAHNERLVEVLLLRNQHVLVDQIEIQSNGKFEAESQVSDF